MSIYDIIKVLISNKYMDNIKRRKDEMDQFKQQLVLTHNGKDRVVVDPNDKERLDWEMKKKQGKESRNFLM